MIMRKYVIVTCLIVFVISTVFCFEEKTEVRAKEKPLVLVLDPGHGGSQSGAASPAPAAATNIPCRCAAARWT